MAIIAIEAAAARREVGEVLGIQGFDCDAAPTPELIAELVRYGASALCPCTPSELVHAVSESLAPICPVEITQLREQFSTMVSELVDYGDLVLESSACDESGRKTRLIHLAPPAFVAIASARALILGVARDNPLPLPHSTWESIERRRHMRFLTLQESGTSAAALSRMGLVQIESETWYGAPSVGTEEQYIAGLKRALSSARAAPPDPRIHYLDPCTPTMHYSSRWKAVTPESQLAICRRPQRYGADVWALSQTQPKGMQKLLDLPVTAGVRTGADEAWLIQAAIDSLRGNPQQFSLFRGGPDTQILEIYLPIPSWVRRYLDCRGAPVKPTRGGLIAYEIGDSQVDGVRLELKRRMWMQEV